MWTRKATLIGGIGLASGIVGLATSSVALVAFCLVALLYLALGATILPRAIFDVQKKASTNYMFEDDKFDVNLVLKNTTSRSHVVEVRDRLRSRLRIDRSTNHGYLAIKAGAQVDWSYGLEAPIKGQYAVGPVEYRMLGPFNLFAQEVVLPKTEEYVTVYPKRERLKALEVKSNTVKSYTGANLVRQPGTGSEFFSLREYQFGDRMKDINWKATARVSAGHEDDQLMVNQRQREVVADAFILLDAREVAASGLESRNSFLWSCRAASTLATALIGRRDRVALAIYGEELRFMPPGGGERHLYDILGAIASVEAGGSLPSSFVVHEIIPRLSTGSPVFLISAFDQDPTVVDAISALRVHKMEVTAVIPDTPEFLHEQGLLDEEAYRVMRVERALTVSEVRAVGARVVDWKPDQTLETALDEVIF